MAKKQNPSRHTPDQRSNADRQASSRHSESEKSSSPRRNDVIRCENCGEDYSITYKRCPFCDERPGRSGISGRRVAGSGNSIHPIQVIGLVVSLVLIIAALFIVFKYVGPLLFGNKPGNSSSSVSTSQSSAQSSSSGGASSPAAPAPGASSSGNAGSQSTDPPVVVTSIQLSHSDFTLRADEEYQMTATVTPAAPGATVVWTSSDSSVLTVDEDGVVKNINHGSSLAKVTVTATAGDKSAACTIYCKPGSTTSGNAGTTGTTGITGTTGSTIAPNTSATIVNAGSGLNIRSGPGSSYEKVASAANGAKIIILEDSGNGWCKIDYGAGKIGYVSKDYISVGN